MSEDNLSALLGLHNTDLAESFERILKRKGYSVDIIPEMNGVLEAVTNKEYRLYIMDINLGSPGSADITPASEIYEKIKQRVENGDAKFVAISGNPITVKAAQEKGIPVTNTGTFFLPDIL